MGIFQNSVLRNTKQDESILAHRWASFQDYLSKIEAIKDFKEEIYQDGFLHDVFEKCLGYTLKTTNPNNYSLDREQKNETDGKKADGAIYIDGKVVGVIELKDQKSKNLDVIEAQAFGYHASHANSRYIIISNFDELRFYIDKKSYYEKFNLFNLSFDEFRKLHLILSYESISSGLTNRLLEQSNRFEVDISKKLYSDFSDFRTHLFENIVKNNIDIDKQTLLRLTQKLCDRLIFILFAEDRGLLRPNTIKEIRGEFANQKFTSYTLYDIYKFYFDAISSGNDRLDIQKYNGGLFAKDELLDSLIIDDEQIDLKAQKLSDYDFMSDIGVNILGHIFEQSLSDIEELNASINDTEFDRKKSKRKKDGVFYTPEYITRYIVENTLGKLCTDKKAELNIIQIEPPKDSRKPTKKEQATKENLEIYRNWLLELKILDPACGSGAFLNQALEFLIREHKSLQQNLVIMGDITAFYDIEEGILEHNLYGVDINEDAVEIAKLSLWLRTAQKGRMLTNLSGKIKCGNSLIDDKSIAQNAFVWEEEFKEVFENGGFDVVIGNPPYVRSSSLSINDKKYFENKFISAIKQYDLYILFYELSINLLRKNGLLSFITPNKFFMADYGLNIRKFIFDNSTLLEIKDISMLNVFADASVYPIILTLQKNNLKSDIKIYSNISNEDEFLNAHSLLVAVSNYNNKEANYVINTNVKNISLIAKIENYGEYLGDKVKISRGFRPPPVNLVINQKQDNAYPLLIGKHLSGAYDLSWDGNYVIYDKNQIQEFKPLDIFLQPKIMVRDIGLKFNAYYDNGKFLCLKTIYFLYDGSENFLKYITSLLNSKLINFYFREKYSSMHIGGGYLRFRKQFIEKIKLQIILETEQQPFIKLVDEILEAKGKIKKYKKHFDTLNAVDKIEITEEIEKLESLVQNNENTIDQMVYKLYGLSEDEIKVVEEIK